MQFLWPYPPPIHELGRIVHTIAVFNSSLENPAHDAQGAVIPGGTVILAVARRPLVAVLLGDSGDVRRIQFRPGLFQRDQNLLFVKLGTRLVVVVIFNFLFEHFNDNFAFDRLAFVDGQSAVILQEVGELEFGNTQYMRFE